ncbi:hypothetical protein [Aquisphaera insulae]|uniref:hypothetical protein n=1 Tax=Aquisphaera insulae TaxID=2712864 RepID=UPI0013EADD7A|nr:hypothetical protein [Aquisphaera insulae]
MGRWPWNLTRICHLSLVLLGLEMLVPSTARAGCHLPTGADPARSPAVLHDLAWLESTGAAAEWSDPVPPWPKAPCTGAFCSGNPDPARSAVPSVPPTSDERWASVDRIDPPPPIGSRFIEAGDEPSRRVEDSRRVFHPPRRIVAAPSV